MSRQIGQAWWILYRGEKKLKVENGLGQSVTVKTKKMRPEDCTCEGNKQPCVSDIISVPLLEPRPSSYQRENHLIDSGNTWINLGREPWTRLLELVDETGGTLWVNGHSSFYGTNDRVPEAM